MVRVLHVLSGKRADGRAVRAALIRVAADEFDITCVRTVAEGQIRLASGRYDVVLCDLPSTGDVPNLSPLAQAPIILLTSESQGERHAHQFEGMARDLLFEETLSIHDLAAALRAAAFGIDRPQEDPSHRDPLTGLLTHAGLMARAERLGHRATAGLLAFWIHCPEIEEIRSKWGDSLADDVVLEVAQLLRTNSRSGDLQARIKDNGFALLALGAPQATGEIILRRIWRASQNLNLAGERPQDLSLQIGLVFADAPRELDRILDRAAQEIIALPEARVILGFPSVC